MDDGSGFLPAAARLAVGVAGEGDVFGDAIESVFEGDLALVGDGAELEGAGGAAAGAVAGEAGEFKA